jgi:hypothetical protein
VQCTKFKNALSPIQPINASVIQGSAIDPASFVVCAADLHPSNQGNYTSKYADDITLIIPASHSHTCTDSSEEIDNISKWASANNLKINTSKSYEMIISPKIRSKSRLLRYLLHLRPISHE